MAENNDFSCTVLGEKGGLKSAQFVLEDFDDFFITP